MTSAAIPHINLLVLKPEYADAWQKALEEQGMTDHVSYKIHESSLSQLGRDVRADLIVSPANSYGILDGGFDDAISRALSLKSDYLALTRHCQSVIYDRYRGFQPPGSCALIQLPAQFQEWSGGTRNVWGIEFIAHCPTMRTPSDCTWDREVVYECIWCLLCEVDKHNQQVKSWGAGRSIKSILMTPLATGTGGVTAEKWAQQSVLAIKHYIDAVQRRSEWIAMNWPAAGALASEVAKTHSL